MRNLLLAPAILLSTATSTVAQSVTIDGSKTYQTIAGFGTCLISWDDRMARWYQRPEASRIYAEELRFNILRTNLWGDGTLGEKANPADISHTDPAFARNDPRTPVFLNFAKAVMRHNPDLWVIGSVWSPPAWMKVNGRITDDASGAIMGDDYMGDKGGQRVEFTNRVRPDRYPHFAKWVAEMVKHYEANGVRMYAVSPANEPQFTQGFESCVWTPKDLATITGMLGETLEREGLGHVQLFAPETMTGFNWDNGPNYRYTQAMRDDPLAWKHLDIWATHGYSDGVNPDLSANSSAKFWSIIQHDGLPYWMTEGGTGGHAWPEPVRENGVGAGIHNALVAGHASAFVPWQYAEDSTSEHNLMPLGGLNKKTHTVRHYSRYIPRGAVRVDASPAFGTDIGLFPSAFVHGNDVTIVLLNTSDTPHTVTLRLSHLPEVRQLNVVRTSANENSAVLPPLPIQDGQVVLTLPAPGIVTLTTLQP
ncbi:MAG: hypothetical protein ACK4PI_02105 [Tepidisphaerales bacterium]